MKVILRASQFKFIDSDFIRTEREKKTIEMNSKILIQTFQIARILT